MQREHGLLRLGEELLVLFDRFFDRADHVERLLGQVIVLAVDDAAEAANGVRERNQLAGDVRELLGDVERLRQELWILRARATVCFVPSESSSIPRIAMMS